MNEVGSILAGTTSSNWDVLWSYVHPSEAPAARCRWEIAFSERKEYRDRFRIMARDGRYREVDVHAWPRLTLSGRFLGMSGECFVEQGTGKFSRDTPLTSPYLVRAAEKK
jgi:hypothetical protein